MKAAKNEKVAITHISIAIDIPKVKKEGEHQVFERTSVLALL